MRLPPISPYPPLAAALCAFVCASVSAPRIVIAQSPGSTPALYDRAEAALAGADTAAALEHLRELTRERDDYAPGFGLLGRILTARASSVATDFADRREAERALRRALEIDRDHPGYLAALGRLMRKQEMVLDSRRMVRRAAEKIDERPDAISPGERAEIWFELGLYEEDAYLDTRGLVYAPRLPVSGVCDAPGFCMNFENPKDFNAHLFEAADLSEHGADEFERMTDAFRAALSADPTHAGAFRRLAIHRIDRGELEEARRLAREYIDAVPDAPWGHLVLGLIHHRTAGDSLAEAAFARGLERAPPDVALHYRDIGGLLPEEPAERYSEANRQVQERIEELLWRRSDPLYLTNTNETRNAHFARVTFADLMYEDPTTGSWGSETERGQIYVRYGAPNGVWQVHRDRSQELTLLEVEEALSGGGGSSTSAHGGGRWIFWNYGLELPNFIFEKAPVYRRTRHLRNSYSKSLEESVRAAVPATYEPSFTVVDYPAQLARFRGEDASTIELDVYTAVPAEELLGSLAADSLDAGVFVFTGPEHRRIYERVLRLPAGRPVLPLPTTRPLPAGRYTVAAEARAPTAAAATRRDVVELTPFGPDLATSDLVLAEAVTPRVPEPADRRDFALRVNRRLEFEPDDPLALYWEIYGLEPDDDGLVRYRVTLAVRDAEGGGVLSRVVGALGDVVGLGGDPEPELSYERVAELRADRVADYVSLELGAREPGSYRAQVRITDLASGGEVVVERDFRIVDPGS